MHPRRRPLSTTFTVVVALAITLGLTLAFWVGLAWIFGQGGSVQVDSDDLALVRSRLEVARQALDAVTPPAGTRANGPAEISGCTVLDGGLEVADPSASRSWRLSGTPPTTADDVVVPTPPSREEVAAVADVVRQLEHLGWTLAPGARGDTMTTLLLDRGPDASLQLTVTSFRGSFWAEATSPPREICRLT